MKIATAALEAIRAHGAEGYPHEICGLLVGDPEEGLVSDTRRLRNVNTERPHDRYDVDSLEDMKVRKEIYAAGLDVVGYYHSHPDHPARPSVFDSKRSWAGYVYVIVSIEKGVAVDTNAYVSEKDEGPLESQPLEVI